MPNTTLPGPVRRFIDAVNRHDLDGMLAAFTADAVVNDHRVEFRGDALRRWAATEIVGDRVTLAVSAAAGGSAAVVVTAAVDGTFPKAGLPSPLVLTFYFTVDGDRIAQLVIVHTQLAARPSPDAVRKIAEQFFARFAAGDVDGVMALFADDATYWFPTTRKALGMRDFADGLRWIQSRLAGPIRFELGPMVVEGDKVAVQAESFATTVDGAPFNNLYHLYFELADGRIVRAREYNDTAHVFATLRAGQPSIG